MMVTTELPDETQPTSTSGLPQQRKVIAEIGPCGGDLKAAIKVAKSAIKNGAWMVKGQMFKADTLVTRTAPTYGKELAEPATQYEAFENALSYRQWQQVADAVDGRFFASVFDIAACVNYPFEWIKIASADITYRSLIDAAASTGKKLIISTGAATMHEIERAISWSGQRPMLLVCTLCYPTEPQDANVRRVKALRDGYNWERVGYSDHTRGIQAAALAFELGASMVEKHYTITPGEGGDHDFAIGPSELKALVEMQPSELVSEAVYEMFGGSSRIGPRNCEAGAKHLARRSWHTSHDMEAGETVTAWKVKAVRPSDGIEPSESIVGRKLLRDVSADTPLTSDLLLG